MRPTGHLLRTAALAAALAIALLAPPASANNAAQALATPYATSDLFQAKSFWRTPIPAGAPLAPDSAAMGAYLARQMGVNPDGTLVPGTSGKRWMDRYVAYAVDAATPYRSVCMRPVLNHASWSWMDALHEQLVTGKVPVPDGITLTDGGADHGLTIFAKAANAYWDFYKWEGPAPAGTVDPKGRRCDFIAGGGGRIRSVGVLPRQADWTASPGYFRQNPPNEYRLWGRRASALPTLAGAIQPAEWDAAAIGHTLQMILPCARAGTFWWPAARNDGCAPATSMAVPEGARVRFDPSIPCPAVNPTSLFSRRVNALCTTMQSHGAITTDQTGNGASVVHRGGIPTAPDNGASNHPSSDYWDALRVQLAHIQVLAIPPHQEWAPGCLC